ncbi:MAG: deaminase [Thermoprotei archaeon]|nr:MAG: deaminase [Thermoprotei archaeon]
MKKAIFTNKAPRPVGPYSQAIKIDKWLFISGQVPIDPLTGQRVEGDFKLKVKRVLENVKAIVEEAGGKLDNVVKVTVFLSDINKFQELNEVYEEYFKDTAPARSVIEAKLPKNFEIMMEVIAYIE